MCTHVHVYSVDIEMEAYTGTNYEYKLWSSVEHRQHMFFAVVACSDVHILLSEGLNRKWGFAYEVVIGGWNNTR